MLLWGSQLLPDENLYGTDQGVAYSDFLKGQVSNIQLPRFQRPQGVVGAAVAVGCSAMSLPRG